MNYSLMNKGIFSIAVVLFIFSFTSCGTTGGTVGLEWGQKTGDEHHQKIKKAQKKGPPPHAPAHGYRAKYKYRYYPSCGIYYDEYRKLYFYLEGINWRISASLPHELQLRLKGYVSVEMDEDKPYIYYEKHKKKYPPGQFKNRYNRRNK